MNIPRWLLLGTLLVAGCQARDGETLRKIARKAGEKLENTARPVNAMTSGMRGSLGEASVAARVESRLRWDRYLSAHRITARGDGKGTITLTGTVPDSSLRTRAADLAQATAGVEKVNDQITVGTSP